MTTKRRRVSILTAISLVAALAPVTVLPTALADDPPLVVVAEVATRGPGGASDEFILIRNDGTAPVDISGWRIQRCNNTGSGFIGDQVTVPAATVLGIGGEFLVTHSTSYTGDRIADATYGTGITDDGGVRILDLADAIVDGVGFGTNNNNCTQGDPASPLSSGDGTAGLSHHRVSNTGDNATDFTKAARSVDEPPAPLVVVAEVATRGPGGASDEFILIRNDGTAPVDISGWRIQRCNNTGSGFIGDQVTVPAATVLGIGGEFLVTHSTSYTGDRIADATYGTGITDDGGVRILDLADAIVDGVGFGTNNNNCTQGDPASPLSSGDGTAGLSHHRVSNTGDNATDFTKAARSVDEPPAPEALVVISQVYGGGGNSGATLKNDFIELFNRGSDPVNLTGWSVQYASAAGSSWTNKTDLSGTIEPGGYFLIQQAAGSGGTEDLPTPDLVGSINLAGGSGKVALVESTTALSGTCPTDGVVDFVGYGTANCFEGTGAAPTLNNTTAALRLDNGNQDTDDNAADFEAGAPNPRNSAGPPAPEALVVISQVYGGGGNSGATLKNDFIELFNRGSDPVNLTGWSVQYASAAGSSWTNKTDLSGTIEPGADLVGSINLAGGSGKVALVESTTALSGTCPTDGVVDFVGYGTANCFEGTGAAPTLNNTTAALRLDNGNQDTDDNAADFETGAPNPRNSSFDPSRVCPAPPLVAKISEIQGTGDVSPCVGESVIVVGDYEGPSPNLRGFYVQRSDDDWDDDPMTSEGIFVFNGDVDDVDLGDWSG
jgi:hypothetical protein